MRMWSRTRRNATLLVIAGCLLTFLLGHRTVPITRSDKHTAYTNITTKYEAKLTLQPGNKVDLSADSKIFYNRVPKCGSRTMLSVIKQMAATHKFHLHESENIKHAHDETLTKSLLTNFTSYTEPFILSGHVFYVNFTRHHIKQPIYINVIRDPMERLISHYNFNRFGSKSAPLGQPRDNFHMTLEECVKSLDDACLGSYIRTILPYFCDPSHKRCWKKASMKSRLAQAKRTVAESFLLVGITEDLASFIEALELALPSFFTGATDVYHKTGAESRNTTSTVAKEKISDVTKLLLKTLLHHEYDFYEFVKQKFYSNLDKLRRRKTQRGNS